jgi:predicted Zn-dependent peptidase
MPREQLLRYYRQYFIPNNIVFVIAGNVDPDAAVEKINKDMEDYDPLLRGSKRRHPPQVVLPELSADPAPVNSFEVDTSEVCIMAGCRAPSMLSDDYPALQVLNALLGEMKTSRMFRNVREKQGLAYELGSFYSPQLYSGDIVAYVFAAPYRIDRDTKKRVPVIPAIQDQILRQFEDMKTTPPTPLELERAKRYLIGTYKVKHERIEERASLLGIAELTSMYGADIDINYAYYIDQVTADDVTRVARKYLIHPAISTVQPDPHNGITVSE